MTVVVLVHAAATLVLTGLIWTIQVVHYPLFALVGDEGFAAYAQAHSSRITLVLAVPWVAQGITTAWLLLSPPPSVPRWLVWAAAVLAAIPVLVTVVASIPAHERLGGGFDAVAHATLVRTNWLRTVAWSAHSIVALVLVVRSTRS